MPLREGYREFIAFLNEVHKRDPYWLQLLISHRPHCNKQIAEHGSIQVAESKFRNGEHVAGFLGLINGFYGAFDEGEHKGCGPVAGYFDDNTGELLGFGVFGEKMDEH